ncbi:zona pellucida-binding protein 2 isoform X3 [Nannospalax galili]|uniref:zona pellucida-binding protein 2 isoform X3 n=1 Tax=Nannospalax galili TaxID=1026970 RepID=UPI00111C5100|nr:zona pellucida-binding protein 2 isoform X3 [Nannospalax galili]
MGRRWARPEAGGSPAVAPRARAVMRAWVLLSAVLSYLAGVGRQRTSLFSRKGFVYGTVGHPVKIYVELHQNSPILVCMDMNHASKETVDPTFLWIGPNENTLTAYREPDYSYHMAVRFTTKSCAGRYNGLLFRVLKKILDNLISDLSCHVIEPSYKCHSVKIPDHDFIYELFIAFQVNPFAPGWKSVCHESADCEDTTNHNILKARDRIEEFFWRQAFILYHHFNKTVPAMHFVDHSFQVIRVDNCRPGFGKNEGLHSNCATCCVVCSPGTFSPDVNVTCQICVSVHAYGATSCP